MALTAPSAGTGPSGVTPASLTGHRLARTMGLVVAICLAAGCAAGPSAKGGATKREEVSARSPVVEESRVAAAQDWESFTQTSAALRAEIARRADALKSGPVGSRAVELASLRLAASGRDLIDAGSLDGALESLQRAVSLDGGNGYAYLFLAYVHHVQGRPEQAAEFASNARRYLPGDEVVRAELEGLALSIRESAATAGT